MSKATTKELQETNKSLANKLDKARQRTNSVLSKVGGLRAHVAANNPTNEDIVRILDSIIEES
mgnify:FL=1